MGKTDGADFLWTVLHVEGGKKKAGYFDLFRDVDDGTNDVRVDEGG